MLPMVTSSATRLWDPGIFDVQCLSAIKFFSTTWVPCLFVPAMKDYLSHGLELSAATQQDPRIRHFILLPCRFLGKPDVCAGTVVHLGNRNFVVTEFEYIHEQDKGNSILIQVTAVIGTFASLTCTYQRTYFSGRQWDPGILQFIFGTWVSSSGNVLHTHILHFSAIYCWLDHDMQPGYLGHMIVILPSALFWFPKWPLSKMQQAENYMMLPPENIARAMFELNLGMITLEFSRDRSASHLPLQFLAFLRISRIEIYSSGTQCSLFPWWFSSDRRAIHERTPQITIYMHV